MLQRLRLALSHWGPWMVLAYIGLVGVVVAGFTLSSNTVRRDAAQDAAIARCLTSRPQLMRISRHLRGVTRLADVLVANSRFTLAATPLDDPQRHVRVRNLRRIEAAQHDIHAVRRLPVPTVAQCEAAQP